MYLVIKEPQNIIKISSIRVGELVEGFIDDQDIKQSSKKLYRRTLKQYFNWVTTKNYLLSEISRPQIIEYKENLLSSGMSNLTVGSYITSVRRFYEWAEANKYYPNVAKGIKTPKRKPQFKKQPLLPAQAIALLDYFKDKTLRDYAIINLLLRTGLRTIEVIRVNIEDITFKGSQRVLLIHGKGRDEKDNFVILTDKTYKYREIYLSSRGKTRYSDPLFTSTSNNSKGRRLSTRTISYIAKEGLKAIGLNSKNFTAHSLRHTTAINILKAGGSMEMVQFTLRHTNPATTQIYTATLNEERRLENSGEALIDNLY
ncbi:tyrosine-type recombinase/integrase [Tenacibaculum finnmarkense genomovar finnmarkense]|uniref:tyrosine-type recombinase/integrase n=1 Tax=Tenacibaculum finnmarkense TaxID=2781243 RepID=UPI001E509AAF|nr:tyrosine-type recombinase/integrase [Tenacibaculum finnmarkense]MCD8418362.1 tyrosine-type recombinase/integrase [Tenacibaculum finnmarkense genomovar finnmarkense]MCG8186800.1 tyrosine-type recombinase/integrase [Tenacibaculum finnmarkense genomovar finnmarkense]MCG8203314.1 tyrosine-type recombinase/integrase [Tenacibaculum finnmarkense genomovar finnmarkense]MCG8213546.1 tyrosine-type recombinase/integrase [Tenacibaculum finnmarkense genomovar finnmarkense]MCG8220877.1 tyrosine-type reco